jgi:DNA (cytosine-5)-methyltransferase 1
MHRAQQQRLQWRPGQVEVEMHPAGSGLKHQITIADLRELVVDNFAGGGGASTGIALAIDRSVDIAINHDPAAIAMHQANHPDTLHLCESVWEVNPRKVTQGQPVGLAWFSPDCTHFSKAKGGKPVSKKIRGLAWVAVRWVAQVRPRVIMIENVEEFVTWGPLIAARDTETGRLLKKVYGEDGESCDIVVAAPGEEVPLELRVMHPDPKRKGQTFRAFVNKLRKFGYQVDWKELRACDYGAPTIRKRFFLVARCDGWPIVWPEPTHGDPKSKAVQSGKLQPWRTAAEIIDWSIPCPSIFERKRPLKEATLRRIARGIMKFVINNATPFIIPVTHHGSDRVASIDAPFPTITAAHRGEHALITPVIDRQFTRSTANAADEPLGTITAGGSGKANLVTAFLTQYHTEATNSAVRGQTVDKPLLTQDASNRYGLVAASLVKHYGGGYTGAGNDPGEPLSTVTAVDHNALVTSHMIKMYGTNVGQRTDEPLHTITAGGFHLGEVRAFLLKYYSTNVGQELDEPLQTVTTKHRFGLVTVHGEDYQIIDIGMRMLEPRELFKANGFPDDYIIDVEINGKKCSKASQVARCGNAVPPHFVKALVEANLPEMCGQISAAAV